MLSIEQTKKLLDDPTIPEAEVELIRDEFRALAEVIFQQWLEERTLAKNQSSPEQPNAPNTS